MIEINRRLYMNQTTGQKTAGFEETAGVLRSVLSALVTGMATA